MSGSLRGPRPVDWPCCWFCWRSCWRPVGGLLLARLVRRALAVPAAPAAVAAAAALLGLGLLALLGLALLVLVLLLALLAVLLGLPLLAGLLGARLRLLLLALLAVLPLLAVLLVLLLLRLRRLGLLLRLRRLAAGSGFFSRTGVPAALIASTSCGFFMEPAPLMPRPFAIAFRSATSMVERPPARFLGAWWLRVFRSREFLHGSVPSADAVRLRR